MRIGVNAFFGEPAPIDQCHDIAAMSFEFVRDDVFWYGPHESPPTLVTEDTLHITCAHLRDAGLELMALVSRPLRTGFMVPSEAAERVRVVRAIASEYPGVLTAFDVGLEGNDSRARIQPQAMVDVINACYDAVEGSVPMAATMVNNMGREALAFATECFKQGLRCDAIGLHPYKTTVKPWEPARGSGWSSRAEEWDRWRELADRYNVKLWAPEWGYHCGVSNVPRPGIMGKLGLKQPLSWTEQQQAEFTQFELLDQLERGVEMTAVFQFNDDKDAATNPNHEAHYGMRRADGTWKPVTVAVRHVQRKQRGE